jgi:hypothetical protein
LVYAAPAAGEEKAVAFQVAEGIWWAVISINSMLRILQGRVGVIFGVAIVVSAVLCRGLDQVEDLPLCVCM